MTTYSLLRRLSDAHQLLVVAVHSPFSPLVPGWPADEVGRVERSPALAEDLGIAGKDGPCLHLVSGGRVAQRPAAGGA